MLSPATAAVAFIQFVLPPLTAPFMISAGTAASALAIILLVLPPLAAPFDRRFLRSNPSTAGKLAYYGLTVTVLWVLTVVAVCILGIDRLRVAPWHWTDWLPLAPIIGPVIGILLAIFIAVALMPLLQSLRGPRWRRAYAKAYRSHAEGFRGLLPDTAVERFAFILLSLTAGICEETLYRGFLIRYLHEGALALPLLAALAASSFAFGLGHIYQGVTSALRIGLVGLAFGLLFLLSGSLIPAIVLHALIDLQGAYVLRPFRDENTSPATT